VEKEVFGMDLNFLKEYDEKEMEAMDKNICTSDRIGIIKRPLFSLDSNCSLWSQIAFSGSVIFPLRPLSEKTFEKMWHIKAQQIPDLLQFAIETKKIHFVLDDLPSSFSDYDYLDPILQKISPPMYTARKENLGQKYLDLKESCADEILFLVDLSPSWQALAAKAGGYHIKSLINVYTGLRYRGFNEIADAIIDNFLANPKLSLYYEDTANRFLINPSVNPLQQNLSLSLKSLESANKLGIGDQLLPKLPFFPEVGSFLTRKITYYPESFESCKKMIDRYEDNDLYNVYSALNVAVNNRNDITTRQKTSEMEIILDNIWKDNRIKRNKILCSYGIDVICGTVGYYLENRGDEIGLLASLGIETVKQLGSEYIERFSELIAKQIATPSMVTVYDFKNKYQNSQTCI
jgi:hypothetical protein